MLNHSDPKLEMGQKKNRDPFCNLRISKDFIKKKVYLT